MIDIRSTTAKLVSRLLSPLETATHIHIMFDSERRGLLITLPRLKLDFFLKEGQTQIVCKQFRGMYIDSNQSFGAFSGLQNMLVLRHEGLSTSRSVIIPHGKVSFSPKQHHVKVSIDTSLANHVKYHVFQIDSRLGQLVDNGSIQSRLLRLYLHAITSHCLVDQLTQRTGTEEALDGLTQAASASFVELDIESLEILHQISDLSPKRQFYPEHLRVMQTVDWNMLSPLSQHSAFHPQVMAILEHAVSVQVFQDRAMNIRGPESRGDPFLLEKAAVRDSSFQACNIFLLFHSTGFVYVTNIRLKQVDGFRATDLVLKLRNISQDKLDYIYQSRDQILDLPRELQTYRMAKLVNQWSTSVDTCSDLFYELESWGTIQGLDAAKAKLTLGFDVKWLDEKPASFLPYSWSQLQAFFSHSQEKKDKYSVMMFLCGLSYSRHAKLVVLRTLLAFATVPELRDLTPPQHSIFTLSEGCEVSPQRLHDAVMRFATVWGDDGAVHEMLPSEFVKEFVNELLDQPSHILSIPSSFKYEACINVSYAMEAVELLYESWHRNSKLKHHVKDVQVRHCNVPMP